ncbi:MAG: alpha-amylase family glycosyl hydrolase [Bacteroidales bacterium]|nr:alpha-amylase family glycosyl hydrolase [Bacteroidales bacterium]
MKKFLTLLAIATLSVACHKTPAPTPTPTPDPEPTPQPEVNNEGWPADYAGVMLQGFYWDSFSDTQWTYLESQAGDIAPYFSLIWVPNSGYCSTSKNMGYLPYKYFDQTSTFGSEAQLRSMIKTYKAKGTGFIADVVINHHNTDGWFDFPKETYKGAEYQFLSTDIVKNDDGGNTKKEADSKGVKLSENNDTGEGWDGCRDLDHKSENVHKIVDAYLDFLLNDLGYAGVRYDMVKGYSASYTGQYNAKAKPEFSVGEYWDGNSSVVNKWMDGTKVDGKIQSGAFDFCFRYTCRDASNNNWGKLLDQTSATSSTYRQYAVTFVENHDTEYRSSSAQQDPIRRDTLAVNAWLLANPGTPCVFYKHWQEYKKEIKYMIEARKLVGITNTSNFTNLSKSSDSYAARQISGKNGKLIVAVGTGYNSYKAPEGFKELISGRKYRYYVSSDCNMSSWEATASRIEKEENPGDFTPYQVTVYVNADYTPVNFYIWDSNNNKELNGVWPGKTISSTVEKGGRKWYTQTVDFKKSGYYFNMVINQGKDKPQSEDITRITSDRYFVTTLKDGKIECTDVTSEYSAK